MPEQCAIPSLFESNFRLPEKVCIVAPGPNGRGHYRRIPLDYCIVAVSKAILIPEVHASVWVMCHSDQDWYREASESFTGTRIFGDAAARNVEADLLAGGSESYCFYPPAQSLLDQVDLSEKAIRTGGSISACALQIAYHCGAKDILLCGVDMSGDAYFDGTLNVQPTHGDTWGAASRVNRLIQWMTTERGLRVRTLTPTRLEAPQYE